MLSIQPPSHPHALTEAEIFDQLATDPASGLQASEAADRLKHFGPNQLAHAKRKPAWLRFMLQFHNPLIYVLLGAGLVTLLLEDYVDAGVILSVVLINAIIGHIQEGKAESALEAVKSMLASHATVIRGGERSVIAAEELVPGDMVLLESGDKVPADLRLFKSKSLRIVEAALTGESVPVEKNTLVSQANDAIADQGGMAFSGTLVVYGQASGIVVATGASTQIGKIGKMVSEVSTLLTPLTRRLDQFARQITTFVLIVGLITFFYGHYVMDMDMLHVFLAVVGLAVAAIPEGLPAVVTIVLAIGTQTMARNKAIVRRLPAVETLGSVSVICSDKTGTLTRNEMTTVRVMLPGRELIVSGVGYGPEGEVHFNGIKIDVSSDACLALIARCAMLCNDSRIRRQEQGWILSGDPTEGALMSFAMKAGLSLTDTLDLFPRLDEIPFESERRYMATLHAEDDRHRFILVKGAPEVILSLCTHQFEDQPIDHARWETDMAHAASQGERILALAWCAVDAETQSLSESDITTRFELLGLLGMIDPPREEAVRAVQLCQTAGIRVKMITGDHAATAQAIGHQLGLQAAVAMTGDQIQAVSDEALRKLALEHDIFARASPEHKLRLVHALQAEGHLVAMTGDGVNDAPALKASNVGVAMGQKGTDAAREAADIVLTDDNFATIARAVREGRAVFDNIKKALLFMLPTNGGEAGVILLAIFAGLAMPVTAAQILWVNMITAVTLALAIAFEPGERDIMENAPRPVSEPLITKVLGIRIIFVSLLMVMATFAVFQWELSRGSSMEIARTSAVNVLVMGELVYLFNIRHFTASSFNLEALTGNRVAIWVSLVLVVFQLLYTYFPPMQTLFQSASLDLISWGVIVVICLVKFVIVELEKSIWRRLGVSRI